MIYIISATFKTDYRCFKSGDSFEFKSANLLVGDQGSGKSSLIGSILKTQTDRSTLDVSLSKKTLAKGCDTFFFDFEHDNPRTKDVREYSNPDGTNRGIGLASAISTKFRSHGEVLRCFSVDAIKKAKNCIVFLDEPESALSIRNQFILANELHAAVDRNCQIFVSTHSLPIIQSFDDVLSLEDRRWMSGESFIVSQTL